MLMTDVLANFVWLVVILRDDGCACEIRSGMLAESSPFATANRSRHLEQPNDYREIVSNEKSKSDFDSGLTLTLMINIRRYLASARYQMKSHFVVIKSFYKDVMEISKKRNTFDWLPKKQLHWYRHAIAHLDKYKKVKKLLLVLREYLQIFSQVFREMRDFGKSQLFVADSVYRTREEILNDVEMHLLLIAVETELAWCRLRSEEEPDEHFANVVERSGWSRQPDHTRAMIQDWVVLTIYYRFLKDWNQIFRNEIRDLGKEVREGFDIAPTA